MEETRFPARLESLAAIRHSVGHAAAAGGLDRGAAYRLMLAVDELASNIIIHGYQENGLDGVIDVTIAVTGDGLTVTMEDDAVPFDPRQHNGPSDEYFDSPLDDRPIGGLGVMLTFDGIDDYDYQWVDGRNRNVLTVRLTPPASPR
jgi:anti-sigma regulatory factor (Ser/Thr protein kinase)